MTCKQHAKKIVQAFSYSHQTVIRFIHVGQENVYKIFCSIGPINFCMPERISYVPNISKEGTDKTEKQSESVTEIKVYCWGRVRRKHDPNEVEDTFLFIYMFP